MATVNPRRPSTVSNAVKLSTGRFTVSWCRHWEGFVAPLSTGCHTMDMNALSAAMATITKHAGNFPERHCDLLLRLTVANVQLAVLYGQEINEAVNRLDPLIEAMGRGSSPHALYELTIEAARIIDKEIEVLMTAAELGLAVILELQETHPTSCGLPD